MAEFEPGLTVVVIFRDSAKTLARLFESLQTLSTQVVAVDTGSVDESVSICKSFGADIYQIEWPDDFAAAKNFGYDIVRTAWTLNLDSDEWLTPEAPNALIRAIDNSGAFAYQLRRQEMQPDGRFTEMMMLRLWRTHPAMRMEGRVHEHFSSGALKSAGGGKLPIASSITIGHDGLTYGGDLTKIERNLRYIDMELKDRPGQLYYELCKVESLLLLSRPDAVEQARLLTDRLLRLPKEAITDECAMMFANFISFLSEADPADPNIDGLIRFIHQRLYRYPPALWAVASVELARGHLWGAYQSLLELNYLSQTDSYPRLNAFNPSILQENLWAALADVSRALGKKGAYDASLALLRKHFPGDPRIPELAWQR